MGIYVKGKTGLSDLTVFDTHNPNRNYRIVIEIFTLAIHDGNREGGFSHQWIEGIRQSR
jgi:hypothetical protein